MFDFLCSSFRSSRALDLLSCVVRISSSLSTRWWLDMGLFFIFVLPFSSFFETGLLAMQSYDYGVYGAT